jgi:hypothetical protein
MVAVSETPGAGSTFAGWSGDCAGTATTCTVTMDVPRSAVGTFNIQSFTLTVTKTLTGSATGTVTSMPAGINCGATCSASYVYNTMVTLTAMPGPGSLFAGWTGDCTGFAFTCTVAVTQARNVKAAFSTQANYVFVTSQMFSPAQLSSMGTGATADQKVLSGADKACNNAAATAGIAGTYVAWMSSATATATSRLGSARGWVRRDGLPFADSLASPTIPGQIFYPVFLDQNGNKPPPPPRAMSGTFADGTTFTGANCNNWASTAASDSVGIGFGSSGTGTWSYGYTAPCNAAYVLYCFGVDYNVVVTGPAPPANEKLAFVTNSGFTPGGGLASADSLCQSEAMGAGKSGSYFAFLATDSASAASRITATGAMYTRVDGVQVSKDSDLANGLDLLAAINLTVDGGRYDSSGIFVGSNTLTMVGPNISCTSWTSTTGSGYGGTDSNTGSGYYSQGNFSCSQAHSILCLQK